MATSMTHRYIPRVEQKEENLFIEEYYSSTDTKIYIDDVEQTEIAYINYSVQEQLKPIYGYSSRTFDDVAVGNRIITGTIKVPIKNPEAQTPKEIVFSYGQNSSNADYNDSQQELMDAIDWITGNGSWTENTVTEDDETFEYRQKLIALGYDLDTNSPNYVLIQQIQQFQRNNELDITGKLDTATTMQIDKLLKANHDDTIAVPPFTKLYSKPMNGSSFRTLRDAQTLYVLDRTYDGWIYVMASNGWEGFVNEKEVSI